LLAAFGSAAGVFGASDRELLEVEGVTGSAVSALREARVDPRVASDGAAATNRGFRLLAITDPAYPNLLASIYAPPALLWMSSVPDRESGPSVAIVGTRRPSPGGNSVAYELAYELAQAGFTVVSGMAYGIDATAHRAALDAGGRTIAVLGSGLLRIYPQRHRRLADEISAGGCLVSEFPLHMEAQPGHFPRRNRIISGLAESTIVVEAYENGGALLTARMALDQNREVFAVPGVITNPAAAGTNMLIRRGEAELLTGPSDLLSLRGTLRDDAEAVQSRHFNIAPSLRQALERGPVHIDELSDMLDQTTADLLVELLRLECCGAVRQLPGKFFHLAAAS